MTILAAALVGLAALASVAPAERDRAYAAGAIDPAPAVQGQAGPAGSRHVPNAITPVRLIDRIIDLNRQELRSAPPGKSKAGKSKGGKSKAGGSKRDR